MSDKFNRFEVAVFGGGCFWCTEAIFQRLKGVEKVTSGYAGGKIEDPSYEEVSRGSTGHTEAVRIEFDPQIITFKDLLNVFFSTHDPTTLNRQGNDIGEQYRSVIFYMLDRQKNEIIERIKKLGEEKIFSKPVITQILPFENFYPAESYHQNYFNNNSTKAYCQVVIDPKIQKLKSKFLHLLKPDIS